MRWQISTDIQKNALGSGFRANNIPWVWTADSCYSTVRDVSFRSSVLSFILTCAVCFMCSGLFVCCVFSLFLRGFLMVCAFNGFCVLCVLCVCVCACVYVWCVFLVVCAFTMMCDSQAQHCSWEQAENVALAPLARHQSWRVNESCFP